MTCKVMVTTPNVSCTTERALIDSASLSSFIHECLAQHPCLPHSSKIARVEGIGETSTPTLGSVWFQVSGVKDNGEKIRGEAFVLKKVMKNLCLHPTPLALKWDHLSD